MQTLGIQQQLLDSTDPIALCCPLRQAQFHVSLYPCFEYRGKFDQWILCINLSVESHEILESCLHVPRVPARLCVTDLTDLSLMERMS